MTKLIWMVARLRAPCPLAVLEQRTGLSGPTIQTGLAQLADTGWYSSPAAIVRAHRGPKVTVPVALLETGQIGVQAKLLYGVMQRVQGFRHPSGHFTHAILSRLSNTSPNTVRGAVTELVHTGWLEVAQASQKAPIRFTFRHPDEDRAAGQVEMARTRPNEAQFKGETSMREYLSLLIDSQEFEDNAAVLLSMDKCPKANSERFLLHRRAPAEA